MMSISLLLLAVPVIVTPLLLRFFYIHAVYMLVRKKEYPLIHELVHSGWDDERIEDLMTKVHAYAKSRVSGFFSPEFDMELDVKAVMLLVQQKFSSKEPGTSKLSFTFTPERLIQSALLLISDFYREFGDKWWFKRLLNIKLIWFKRGKGLKNLIDSVKKIKIVRTIVSARVIGPVFRFLLIPVIGPPIIAFYLVRSLTVTAFWEGWIRYIYSVLLVRFAYYTVFLYSSGNSVIEKRLSQFSRRNISKRTEYIEQFFDPVTWGEKSPEYPDAVLSYTEFLKTIDQPKDDRVFGGPEERSVFSETARGVKKMLSVFIRSSGRAIKKQIRNYGHPEYGRQLIGMASSIGRSYYDAHPFYNICIHEILLTSYSASLFLLGQIYKAPGSSPLLRSVSIDILFKIKSFAETDIAGYILKSAKFSGRIGTILFQTRKGLNLLKGSGGILSFFLSLGPPILYQHIEDGIITFLFHRWGRCLLRLFEESKKSSRNKTRLYDVF